LGVRAIAWVAKRNNVPLLILRGVSDLISVRKGEAEGDLELFSKNARQVMLNLLQDLPSYVAILCQE
jgi:nucleoside phosphorylase